MCDKHDLEVKNLKQQIVDLKAQLQAVHDSRIDWREAANSRPVLDDLRGASK